MAMPRATSNEADELAATLAAMKSRLNELETMQFPTAAPIGSILDYLGVSAPSGWAFLDGSTISNGKSLYPQLWDLLPLTMKTTSDIVLPDMRGRVSVHRGASGTFDNPIGTTGGAETVTLTTSQMPQHQHGMSHDHFVAGTDTINEGTGASVTVYVAGTSRRSTVPYVTGTSTQKPNTDFTGSDAAHNNIQPYMITMKIIRLI